MKRVNPTRETRRSAGFTLIELLVVIAIIALLLGILLPAFGRARDLSRSAATQARVTSLADACEAFKQDHGAYPGATRWPMANTMQRPFFMLNNGIMAGSQQLALCLLDYHWTGPTTWETMTTYLNNTPSTTDDRPSRRYADLGDSALDGASTTTRYNAILDTFPAKMPILYFPARPGQVGTRSVYVWADNGGIDDAYLPDTCPEDGRDLEDEFYTLITREGNRPYRQDSFILIAPGIDRQWFTGDDNSNFGN